MASAPDNLYFSIVGAAVLNKYADASSQTIAKLVTTTLDAIAGLSKNQLVSRLRPVAGVADDINNQTVVLTLIELYWSNPPNLDQPLTTLNTSSFGKASPAFRVNDYVEDFGGEVPTSKSEVHARLDELERLCREAVRGMGGSPLEDKALILAHIFGSLVRIHPFEDGNGRTARLFAFYALRCWGLPLFPIPKVRNDPGWKDAMESAVAGDALKLKNELNWRMEEAIRSGDCYEGK